jgi:ABC-type multidrug transport system ATPase subunit
MLRVSQVSKRYGKVEVLHSVSFDTAPGEALALWGPNGAGKTTLVKAILGLIDHAGEIRVNGYETHRNGKQARRLIGYVPQEAIFYDWTVQATMAFYATLKKADPVQIQPLLERMGLVEHTRKPVPALSGGLKQRMALAVALLGDPPILLLDEPMANLDARTRDEYRALLATLRREGKTILFSSHRLEEVESLADRVLVLERGELKSILTPQALRKSLYSDQSMVLWVPEAQRAQALAALLQQGVPAHLNGRGTVVARIGADGKLHLLRVLAEQGIQVADFDLELGKSDTQGMVS